MKNESRYRLIIVVLLVLSCMSLAGAAPQQGATAAAAAAGTALAGAPADRMIDYFEVHDADLRSVCRQLSSYSGVDIVLGENVKGSVTISVSNKSWREILAIICKINGLAAIVEETYVYLVPEGEYKKRQLDDVTGVQLSQEVSPLRREVIKLNHMTAAEVKESIQSLLSARGKITVVAHNNALIIFDTESNIAQIRQMIGEIDVETAQISISCRIIEVNSGVIQNMGIHWGFMDSIGNGLLKGQHLPSEDFIAGAIDKLSYGILSPQNLRVALEYLFSDDRGEVVAQPQITTLDNKEARIFMGQQIPVKFKDEAGNTVIQMVNAGTALVVTPHISGEGRIMMQLNPKKESYVLQDGVPVINQQNAMTNVVVNNGETVVIAGLTANESHNSDAGIPFLKDIPLIGNLFKKSSKISNKKDLVIFVTPNIIRKTPPVKAAGG